MKLQTFHRSGFSTPARVQDACCGQRSVRAAIFSSSQSDRSSSGKKSAASAPFYNGNSQSLKAPSTSTRPPRDILQQLVRVGDQPRLVAAPDTNLTVVPPATSAKPLVEAWVEFEPRFYGLRAVNQKDGTFEADFGLKVRWGPPPHLAPTPEAAARVRVPVPQYYVSDTLGIAELDRSAVVPLPGRPGWQEQYMRWRSTSLANFQLQNFPYDSHRLQVVVRVPRIKQQGITHMSVLPEGKTPPTQPDMGLQDWLVLRRRCFVRTSQAGVRVPWRATSTLRAPAEEPARDEVEHPENTEDIDLEMDSMQADMNALTSADAKFRAGAALGGPDHHYDYGGEGYVYDYDAEQALASADGEQQQQQRQGTDKHSSLQPVGNNSNNSNNGAGNRSPAAFAAGSSGQLSTYGAPGSGGTQGNGNVARGLLKPSVIRSSLPYRDDFPGAICPVDAANLLATPVGAALASFDDDGVRIDLCGLLSQPHPRSAPAQLSSSNKNTNASGSGSMSNGAHVLNGASPTANSSSSSVNSPSALLGTPPSAAELAAAEAASTSNMLRFEALASSAAAAAAAAAAGAQRTMSNRQAGIPGGGRHAAATAGGGQASSSSSSLLEGHRDGAVQGVDGNHEAVAAAYAQQQQQQQQWEAQQRSGAVPHYAERNTEPLVVADNSTEAKPELVLEFLVQRRASFWMTSVMLPLLVMELFVPLAYALPPSDLGYKLTIANTLLLLLVSYKLALTDRLPAVSYLTTLDRHFVYSQVWMIVNAIAHVGSYVLYANQETYVGLEPPFNMLGDLSFRPKAESAALIASIIAILFDHASIYVRFHVPYMRVVEMFERRNTYSPPVVKKMNSWSSYDF